MRCWLVLVLVLLVLLLLLLLLPRFACRFATTFSNSSLHNNSSSSSSSNNNNNNATSCATVSLSNNAGEQWCGNVTFWRWPGPVSGSSSSSSSSSCVELRSSAAVPAHVDADDDALVADNVCVQGYDVFVLRCCEGSS